MVNENPYQTPAAMKPGFGQISHSIGKIGFALSLMGVTGLLGGMSLVGNGWEFGKIIVLLSLVLCPLGLISSFIGLFFPSRRLAIWGALVGLYGSLHVPTFVTTYMLLK
ncbi:hypothetical protein N9Z53_02100 [Mariniblastus sp.]|nr:hypothetical protein [bacterium]MDA7923087.1 hypothetical protein [bacterium]MDB4372546.1 hypothetical protein [Mariniblastus sp.]